MRIFYFIVFVFLFIAVHNLSVAQAGKEKNPRILILLDGSSSMLHDWSDGNIRFKAAAKIVDRLMDSVYAVNKNVEFALRVYGHQYPTSSNNCGDTKLEVMFSKDNYTQMMLRLAALSPLGISPIAYSIKQAAEQDMHNLKDNKYSLILITDGGESCDGDICGVVEQLLKNKIDFKPYILSLVKNATLKQQYDCMGDYLLVAQPDDIEPVVGKIVESYRKTFIQPAIATKLIDASRNTPGVLQVKTPPAVIKVPEKEPVTKTKTQKPVVIQQPAPKPKPKPQVVVPKPKQPTPEPEKPSNIVVQDVVLPARKKVNVVSLPTTRQRILPQMYTSRSFIFVKEPLVIAPKEEVAPAPVARPTEPTYKPLPVTTSKSSTVATPRAAPQPKEMEYSVSRTDAQETSLTIFFTNGKGKYYETSPEIVLRDTKTNEPVYKFDRDVDAYGKPRPQKTIPPGTYNLTITGKDGFSAPNIEVRANQSNKYELIVSSGSLAFTYHKNPSRPVKEFSARVAVAFRRGAINTQLCSEIVTYEPENYHIEISTNPITTRNVDLDFGVTVFIGIEEPGGIEVINPNGYQRVQFYYQLGNSYELFKPMNVVGDNAKQEFMIQPGRYKVAYIKNTQHPDPKPVVKPFIIKSNTITEVVLD